jgi:hypothetical protein
MTYPGPPSALWAVALLLWALVAVVLGEAIRMLSSRWIPLWRINEPIERGLVDLFLGGAAFYLIAALPIGAFSQPVVLGIPVAAGAYLIVRVALIRRSGTRPAIEASLARLMRPWVLVAIASAVGLYLVEVGVALVVPTGNTYDSSLLTTYTALLLQHHSLPLSFSPYAAQRVIYPQGTTVWLGWAQVDFGLPPARTSLLVTPLFFALVPLSGFVFGRRMLGTDSAGAVVALVLAWLASSTRIVAWGSNDFVVAFPLVLLLAAESEVWIRGTWWRGDAIGFGLLLGYSAAMNPVGAEWMLPGLLVLGIVARPTEVKSLVQRICQWLATLGSSLVALTPSIYTLALASASSGFGPAAGPGVGGGRAGLSLAGWLGGIDPFLFGRSNVYFSPLPVVRIELALLFLLGLLLCVGVRSPSAIDRFLGPARRWALVSGVIVVAWMGLLVARGYGWSPVRDITVITSAQELSLWLFTIFGIIAAVPIVVFVRCISPAHSAPRAPSEASPGQRPGKSWLRVRRSLISTLVVIALVGILLVPGIVLTPTSFARGLEADYESYSMVSSADFALLEFAGSYLPAGSRVLVAPGSVAEFLPGYAANVVLLYPMIDMGSANASYTLLVQELTNDTLNASGNSSLAALSVQFILVTMRNTDLWPAFLPGPLLLNATRFPIEFHEADAYLFAVS